jgi:hypothetical protein
MLFPKLQIFGPHDGRTPRLGLVVYTQGVKERPILAAAFVTLPPAAGGKAGVTVLSGPVTVKGGQLWVQGKVFGDVLLPVTVTKDRAPAGWRPSEVVRCDLGQLRDRWAKAGLGKLRYLVRRYNPDNQPPVILLGEDGVLYELALPTIGDGPVYAVSGVAPGTPSGGGPAPVPHIQASNGGMASGSSGPGGAGQSIPQVRIQAFKEWVAFWKRDAVIKGGNVVTQSRRLVEDAKTPLLGLSPDLGELSPAERTFLAQQVSGACIEILYERPRGAAKLRTDLLTAAKLVTAQSFVKAATELAINARHEVDPAAAREDLDAAHDLVLEAFRVARGEYPEEPGRALREVLGKDPSTAEGLALILLLPGKDAGPELNQMLTAICEGPDSDEAAAENAAQAKFVLTGYYLAKWDLVAGQMPAALAFVSKQFPTEQGPASTEMIEQFFKSQRQMRELNRVQRKTLLGLFINLPPELPE